MAKITIGTGIYSSTAEAFINKLFEVPEDEDIEVYINSPGGSVFAGWSIIGALSERSGQKIAKVYGDASSMALYMLLFMDKVEALDVSTFLIHRADGYTETEEEKKFLSDVNKQIRTKLEMKINKDTFKEATGVSFDEIFDMENRKNVNLSAKQAKKIGLVDKIIRLEPQQIAALNDRFVGFVDFESQGSDQKPQGSGKQKPTEDKNSINIQTKKRMTKEELKAQHPDIYADILKDGAKAEKDDIEAILEFYDVDRETCKKMIAEGTKPTQKFYAEMTRKIISAAKVEDAKTDSPGAIEIKDKKETNAKTPEQIKAEKETLDFEAEARRAACLEDVKKEEGK